MNVSLVCSYYTVRSSEYLTFAITGQILLLDPQELHIHTSLYREAKVELLSELRWTITFSFEVLI